MCDSITNGYAVFGGGGGGATTVNINSCQPPIPPMIYISNGNSLNTFYGLSASNLYSVNSFTGNLTVYDNLTINGNITGNVVNVTTLNV